MSKTPRFWFYKPGSWLSAWPVALGSDEWCRRTIVLGNWLTGCIVIALWQMDDPECPECTRRRFRGRDRTTFAWVDGDEFRTRNGIQMIRTRGHWPDPHDDWVIRSDAWANRAAHNGRLVKCKALGIGGQR